MLLRRQAVKRIALSVVLALAWLLVASDASVAEGARHSGTVVAIDPQRGVMVIDEVGPGRGPTPTIVRRTIGFTTATRFRSFIRVDVHGAFAGDFIEVALDAEDVSVGDLVTAECVSARGGLVATRVTVAESVQTHSSPGSDRP